MSSIDGALVIMKRARKHGALKRGDFCYLPSSINRLRDGSSMMNAVAGPALSVQEPANQGGRKTGPPTNI
jgi:hypothetical protein